MERMRDQKEKILEILANINKENIENMMRKKYLKMKKIF